MNLLQLKPYINDELSKNLIKSLTRPPSYLVAGFLGSMSFVITYDHNYQSYEVSLALKSGRPTQSQIRAFFKKLDISVPDHKPLITLQGRAYHWVITKEDLYGSRPQ